MLDQLENTYQLAARELDSITDRTALEVWENTYLGKKGSVLAMLRSVGQLPKEERAAFGQRANAIKDELETAYHTRETFIRERELAHDLESGEIDVTLPGRSTLTEIGRAHV